MTIRTALPGDARAVAALISLAYRVEDFFKIGDRTDEDDVRARMGKGDFLLLEDAMGTLAGCVYVSVRGETGYFGMLSIDPARQGQGLGRRLIGAAEDHCRRAGCREMELEVVNLRTELPPFYRRMGYVESATRAFPDHERAKLPCHFIVMTKPLEPADGRNHGDTPTPDS
jgi:GNAT superfamily N-acetyltransferase